MSIPICVLVLEDNPNDAELMVRALRRAGFAPDWQRVDTETDYLVRLDPALDVILADFNLPQFDAMRALRLLQGRGLDIPFIIVSGTVGEETAVVALQQGASDYLLKDRLACLGPAVTRALEQKRLRDEKRGAEVALRESEERYRQLVELSPDAILIHVRGKIAFLNTTATKLLGAATSEELIGRPIFDFVHPDYREAARARTQQVLDSQKIAPPIEQKIIRVDGAVLDVESRASLFIYRGQPAVQSVLRDVTERKRLEQQLFQAQKMEAVGTLAGGIAHDFNNLLTGIIGSAQLALMEDEGRWREYIHRIPEQCDRAARLISQLLAFSRRAVTEPQPLPLLFFVRETIKLLERTVPEHIAIRLAASGEVAIVNVDPTQMQQVIVNLCINASQAMPHGGELTLGLEGVTLDEAYCRAHADLHAGKYICLWVRDTGVGMTPEVQERIFEPFYTTKGVGEGTGLGLAMVYGIIKAHAGHIAVRSEVGQGSEFRVYLPAMEAVETTLRVVSAEEPPVGGTETLLMVEDEDTVLAIGRAMLETLGYTVLTATDGEEALNLYRAHREEIALVVTDMVMPKMGGQELYEALIETHPAVKVLLMTGYSVKEDVADLRERGLKGVLNKPFNFDALSRAVRQAIDS